MNSAQSGTESFSHFASNLVTYHQGPLRRLYKNHTSLAAQDERHATPEHCLRHLHSTAMGASQYESAREALYSRARAGVKPRVTMVRILRNLLEDGIHDKTRCSSRL